MKLKIISCNKTNQMHQFIKFIFCNKTLYVSDSFSVHHQEIFTVHTAILCHIGLLTAYEQDQDVCPDPTRKLSAKRMTYTTTVCTVKNS